MYEGCYENKIYNKYKELNTQLARTSFLYCYNQRLLTCIPCPEMELVVRITVTTAEMYYLPPNCA